MTTTPESARWGSLALVSYIPDPLGSFLQSLREFLPGEENHQAHLTLLPPRPLRQPLEAALQQAQSVLDRFASFEVKLSEVRCFPGTKILYLDIAEGSETIHEVHDALNTGGLLDDELFEFSPHLTIGGPVREDQMKPVLGQAEDAWRSNEHSPAFLLEEVIGLWSPAATAPDDWRRIWSYKLKSKSVGAANSGLV